MIATTRTLVSAMVLLGCAGCTSARLSSSDREARVLVYNMHAGKDAKGVDNLSRIAALVDSLRADIVLLEIRTVLAIVDTLRRRGVATMAGGDFNSTPESSTHESVRAAGLRDAWDICGQGDGLTYPADSSVKRIDYLFLTGTATCRQATVVRTEASDHRPVFFIVRGW